MSRFAIDMALLRGLHLAATLSLLGTAGFIAWMLPAAAAVPSSLRRCLDHACWISGLVALVAGAGWFALQAAAIADASTVADGLAAVPLVAMHTRFGTVVMLRLGLLVLATTSSLIMASLGSTHRPVPGGAADGPHGPHDRHGAVPPGATPAPQPADRGAGSLWLFATLILTAVALGLEGLIGHAGATAGAIGDGLVLSEALHLLAAGVWLGALIPLWLTVRRLPPDVAAPVCERFSPFGLACVLVLAGTGTMQGLQMIGSVPALFGTPYGQIALLKIALFLVALVLAAINRLWFTDRLATAGAAARRHLLGSVAIETGVGLAIVVAAAFMASSPPARHTTPVWPLSWRFSLTTVNEDPDSWRDVMISLGAIGAALVLVAVTLFWRRFRLAALAVLALTLAWRAPALTLLTVEAYPTSFQTSPTGFSAAAIVRGEVLFARNCAGCHGPEGEGNGPSAAVLHVKPADLTQPHLWEHSDGEMFWWLTHGIDDPESGLAMPGFAASLSADDRWALIDFVRAHNAGLAMQRDVALDHPLPAPSFAVACSGVDASRIADLRHDVVHVIADAAPRFQVPPQSGVRTITLTLRRTGTPEAGTCVAADPTAWNAFAVLADLSPGTLSGAEFLIDPDGWLRAMHRPGAPGGWNTEDDLAAAVRGIRDRPIQQSSGAQHEHH